MAFLAQHDGTPLTKRCRSQEGMGAARCLGLLGPDFVVFLPLPAAATFMEHWKRKQMRLNYRWDLTGFEEEEVSGEPCALPRRRPLAPGDAPGRPRPGGPGKAAPAGFSVHIPGV